MDRNEITAIAYRFPDTIRLLTLGFYGMGDYETAAPLLKAYYRYLRSTGRYRTLDREMARAESDLRTRGYDVEPPNIDREVIEEQRALYDADHPPQDYVTRVTERLGTFIQEHPYISAGIVVGGLYVLESNARAQRDEQERQRLSEARQRAEQEWRRAENIRRAQQGLPSLEADEAREQAERRRVNCPIEAQATRADCLSRANQCTNLLFGTTMVCTEHPGGRERYEQNLSRCESSYADNLRRCTDL